MNLYPQIDTDVSQFCLSDLVVVWRAWALWPDSRLIRWMLGAITDVTAGNGTSKLANKSSNDLHPSLYDNKCNNGDSR